MIPCRNGPRATPSQWMVAPSLRVGAPKRRVSFEIQSSPSTSHDIGWFEAWDAPTSGRSASGEGRAGSAEPWQPDDLLLRLAVALQSPPRLFTDEDGPLRWHAPLAPYQCDGVETLLTRREVLLADDMGLGKTVQAAAALRILCFREGIQCALVVCPASLVHQWRSELRVWAPELAVVPVSGPPAERGRLWRMPAHVHLVGYETLRGDVLDLHNSPVLRKRWDVVLLDEASRIKNRDSGISQACKRIPRDRRWALTGTPLENSTEDLVSLLDFLLGEPGERTLHRHATNFRPTLKTLQLRRKKGDVLPDLPPLRIEELTLELGTRQREAYDRAEQEGTLRLQQYGPALTITHVLELISRLKQICNAEPVTGESAKMQDISARLATLVAEGHRALVFSQFTDGLFGVDMVARILRGFHPLKFTGAMSAKQRSDVLRAFRTDPRHKAMILSLRAGGVGLNLQSASYVFHMDRWWNPAIEDQAESRAHRLGQSYPVTAFRYVCADTIEERIEAILREKRHIFQQFVDDVTLDLKSMLTADEMFGLFGLP
ncbi:MAG: DEAD/DEAH box helicase [Planctomycetaceae bacterium]|nr:MAG: DEAD/DEAH box helicase [Planctomycetaceae bacterium]